MKFLTTRTLLILALMFGALTFVACSEDEDPEPGNLTLNFTNLQNLGPDYVYEGWLMVDGAPVTTGTFTVDDNGAASQTSFEVDAETLDNATAFILSIEPANDPDPAPSAVKVVAGDFSGNTATATMADGRAIGADFSTGSGTYHIATPTTTETSDSNSGIWFVDAGSASLALPTLKEGWVYEGWVVMDGTPVSTGTFTKFDEADSGNPYSGTTGTTPAFPGEDFIMNAPMGLTFPTDLSGMKVVISVEPAPDNSAMPFVLKPWSSDIATPAADGSLSYDASTNISGTATR